MQIDKLKHLIIGYVIAVLAICVTIPPLYAFALGCTAGFAKDVVWDLWGKRGQFEWADIIMTCLGALAAVLPLMVYAAAQAVRVYLNV